MPSCQTNITQQMRYPLIGEQIKKTNAGFAFGQNPVQKGACHLDTDEEEMSLSEPGLCCERCHSQTRSSYILCDITHVGATSDNLPPSLSVCRSPKLHATIYRKPRMFMCVLILQNKANKGVKRSEHICTPHAVTGQQSSQLPFTSFVVIILLNLTIIPVAFLREQPGPNKHSSIYGKM